MAFTNALFDPMLDAAGSRSETASLHSSNPGSDGSNEIAGGAYARQPLSWASADGGSISTANAASFDVPGGTTVAYVGLWNTAGWLGAIALDVPEEFTEAGTYDVQTVTISAGNE